MRILYLGNIQGFVNPAKYYFTPQKLMNGFMRLGHMVYAFNDRDYARYSNILRSQKWGIKALNKEVVRVAREFRPDMIVFGHCKNISNDTLAEIRAAVPGVRMMYRNVDPIHQDAAQNIADIKQRVGHVEGIFITTAGEALAQFSHPKTRVSFFPNPVDRAVEDKKAFANPNADIDMLFLGSVLRDQYDHRQDTVRYLLDNKGDLNIHIGGAGQNDGKVFGAAYYELLERAKMGLCTNKTNDFYLYASGRMSQYMASGMLAFIPRASRFEDILGTDSFVSFDSDEEIVDRMRYFAAHDGERKLVAQTGYEKVHDYFNVDKICQYMIETVFDQPHSQDYRWPTTLY